MKNMWIAKDKCTGCGACENACPKNAIELNSDECGFIYPEISADKCVNCGICEKVCIARLEIKRNNSSEPLTFAAWSKDTETRFTSTSGGVFSELAKSILDKGGYVAGALYNAENMVEHSLINDIEGLDKLKQSKYIQSNAKLIYKQVKEKLQDGKIVAFCGAPCQVAALYAYLGKDYDNLISFDFICRGMNSPKAFKSWLSEIENQKSSQVIKVWFKYKVNGWKKSPRCIRLDFADNTYKIISDENNLFMSGYLSNNLYIRPACCNCDFKGIPRQGDITLADFWKVDLSLDDDKGTSMVLCNNEKGLKLFESIKSNIKYYKRDFKEIFAGNVCFKESVKYNPKSAEFLKSLDDQSFSKTYKKYSKKTLLYKLKNLGFRLLRKIKHTLEQ